MEKCLHFSTLRVDFTKEVSQVLVSRTKPCERALKAHAATVRATNFSS